MSSRTLWTLREKAHTALLLWWDGLKQALSLHKCLAFFVHDHQIWVKTFRCVVLNGVIFLGSITAFQSAVAPALRWLLANSFARAAGPSAAEAALAAFAFMYHALWLLPAYMVSLVVSGMWYNDIARHTVAVQRAQKRQQRQEQGQAPGVPPGSAASWQQQLQQQSPQQTGQQQHHRQPRQQPMSLTVGQEVYRVALCTVFLLQAAAVGFVPIIGHALEVALLSWLYALYCFDYRWHLDGVPLAARLAFFERHWAFFGGFGSVCALAAVFLPFYTGAATMAVLFPLFIIISCSISPTERSQHVVMSRPVAALPGSLRLFWPAEAMTAFLFRHGGSALGLLRVFGSR